MITKRRNRHRPSIEQSEDPRLRIIALTQQKTTTVEATDYNWLMQWKWFARRSKGYFYAGRYERDELGILRFFTMQTALLRPREGFIADHENGDTLDNRRCNLREATHQENIHNRKIHRNNTSGFPGVYFNKQRKKFRAAITINGKLIQLGWYDTAAPAGMAYHEAANNYFGKFYRNPLSIAQKSATRL